MKRAPQNQPNLTIFRERNTGTETRLALLLLAGLLLAGGFIFAAGQRFVAVRYGYQGEKLRQEREQLLEQQRRLLLAREEAAAPSRLETEARKLGLQSAEAAQVGTASADRNRFPQTAAALSAPSSSLGR